jgi:flavin reductase (DIM6/NTAB) family NADH-FMN oxidoreductase RutF
MSEDPIKDALNLLPYGFYAISSRDDREINIMVATWVIQSSFEPRLVTLALQKTAYSHELIERGKVFAINIFRVDDSDVVKSFTKSRKKNPDKLEEADFTPGPETGCPILEQAAAYMECKVVKIVDVGGDHDLIVGKVVGAGVRKPGEVEDTLTLSDIGWTYAG